MRETKSISLSKAFTLFYTWVVVLSCTMIGHIFSDILGVYLLTAAVIVSVIFIILNRVLSVGMKLKIDLLLLIYVGLYIYAAIRGVGGFEAFLPLLAIIVCADFGSNYAFDLSLARKLIELIATIATILLLVQVCYHYIFGGHIQMLPTSFLTQEQYESYEATLKTGVSVGSTYYRPSSIFLEPSHYVQFTIVAFLSVLYPAPGKTVQFKKTLLYTIGIIATISSTGIALLIVFWGLWILFSQTGHQIPKGLKFIVGGCMVVVIVMMVMSSNSTLGVYINRILPSNLINLIDSQEGRFWAARYLDSFSGTEWLMGRGIGTQPEGFFTGYIRTVYQMGIIGFISYVILLTKVAWKSNGFCRYVGVAYIILLFGAEVDVLRYIVFYLTFAFVGYTDSNGGKGLKLTRAYRMR